MHTIKETDMLATKLDLLLKWLDGRSQDKAPMHITLQALDTHMTCEVCGNTEHLGNDRPEIHEDMEIKGGTSCAPTTKGITLVILYGKLSSEEPSSRLPLTVQPL
ncbi:hypothetical protein GQ55_7G084800 [Panicum hallii var. hallii]|uniref:Uncharacterized protein n=1 Tax=Panicum hallii var. hallii TaxID=1504633 RepID=A0A2T7CT48_9POAL|nr:hypothetical protein GQ55_7G084800 [Panicum hallii var. hallii]